MDKIDTLQQGEILDACLVATNRRVGRVVEKETLHQQCSAPPKPF